MDRDYFSGTGSITGMVQISCFISEESGIDNELLIKSKQIAITNSTFLIDFFSFICDLISDFLSYVLNNNISLDQIFQYI